MNIATGEELSAIKMGMNIANGKELSVIKMVIDWLKRSYSYTGQIGYKFFD